MKKIILIAAMCLIQQSAFAKTCACELANQIKFGFNEGGTTVTNMVGPIVYNQPVGSPEDGTAGIVPMVAYAISVDVDKEVLPDGKATNHLVTAQCDVNEVNETEKLMDKDGDGVFTLNDAEIKGL